MELEPLDVTLPFEGCARLALGEPSEQPLVLPYVVGIGSIEVDGSKTVDEALSCRARCPDERVAGPLRRSWVAWRHPRIPPPSSTPTSPGHVS